MSSPANSLSVTIPSVHTAALFKRSSKGGKKKSSRGSKKNSTRMPTKGKKEKAGERKKKTLAFVVKRTNEAAFRTVHGETTSMCTHTHCENASYPR